MPAMRRLPIAPTSPLPPLYDAWMREALGEAIPGEPESTCADCAMVASPGDDVGDGLSFDPRVKCCTHFPRLPNFLVGRILADRSAAGRHGREATRSRIRARVAVSPMALCAPALRRQAERLAGSHGDFGRVASLVCPHYVERDGRCGIWQNRNSVCATFYCKHERGPVSSAFWRGGLEPLLDSVEAALARHCLLSLGLPTPTLANVDVPARASDVDAVTGHELAPDAERYQEMWGPWEGREEAFYRACGELVAGLSWSDVLRIGGAEVAVRARVATWRFEVLQRRAVPARLRGGPCSGVVIGREFTRIVTYSQLDPLDLPNALVAALSRFDGRRTATVVREVERELGVQVDEDLLVRLVDFGILAAVDGPPRAAGR